jgi:hypothetical protein
MIQLTHIKHKEKAATPAAVAAVSHARFIRFVFSVTERRTKNITRLGDI